MGGKYEFTRVDREEAMAKIRASIQGGPGPSIKAQLAPKETQPKRLSAGDAMADAVDAVRAAQLGDKATAAKYEGSPELLAIARGLSAPLHPITTKEMALATAHGKTEDKPLTMKMMFSVGSGQHVHMNLSHLAGTEHWLMEYKNKQQPHVLSKEEKQDLANALKMHAGTPHTVDRIAQVVQKALEHLPAPK